MANRPAQKPSETPRPTLGKGRQQILGWVGARGGGGELTQNLCFSLGAIEYVSPASLKRISPIRSRLLAACHSCCTLRSPRTSYPAVSFAFPGSGSISFPLSSFSSPISLFLKGYSKSTLIRSSGAVDLQSTTARGKSLAGCPIGLHTFISWCLLLSNSSASPAGTCRRTLVSAAFGVWSTWTCCTGCRGDDGSCLLIVWSNITTLSTPGPSFSLSSCSTSA